MPFEHLFCNVYDGFKNYLTFHSYVLQDDFSKVYQQMNYPYGDFISFTDNTPLLSVLFKSLLLIFPDWVEYDLVFYNTFCLFSIIFTAWILYKIFELLEVPTVLAFVFAVVLPWISPQVERLYSGHLNLSFSWVIPMGIWLLLYFHKKALVSDFKSLYRQIPLWIIFFVSVTFIHIYYLAILFVFTGLFAGIWFLSELIQKKKYAFRSPAMLLLVSIVISFVTAMVILMLLDPKPELRQSFAEGYDFDDWKLSFRSIYRNPDFIPFRSWIGWEIPSVTYESYMYIGGAFLMGIVVFFIAAPKWKSWLESSHFFTVLTLGISGFLCVSIAMGEEVRIGEESYTNFLNPFFYLHFLTDRIEQFRCLSRFGWAFFWSANIGMVYFLGILYRSGKWKYLVLPVVLIGIFETFLFAKNGSQANSLSILQAKYIQADTQELLNGMDTEKFQAILPIPFYHVGCENYDYTIDPDEGFFKLTSMLSLATNLPNMGCKMSRTPVIEAQSLMSIFHEEIGQKKYFLERLDRNKPVLVVLDKEFYAGLTDDKLPGREIPRAVIQNGKSFVENLRHLKSVGRYDLYEWYPQ